MGHNTVLTREEENTVLNEMLENAKKGIRTKRSHIISAVIKIIQSDNRRTPFNNGKPGTKWLTLFRRRHANIFDQYELIIGNKKGTDSDSDSLMQVVKMKKQKKARKFGAKKPTVAKVVTPPHAEEYPHSPGEQSDSSSKKSIAEEEIDDKQFAPGSILEVMDFNEKWYPVKVIEVDYEENEVLVHYLKWSDRYDEWVRMDSNRIRRPTQPSSSSRHNFKVGEKVMATWSYSLKFPAVIQALHDDDKVDVLFYDGFTKTLKSCKLSKANEEDLKNMSAPQVYKVAPPVGSDPVETDLCSKEERRERKRKINILEVFHPQLNKKRKIAEVESKAAEMKQKRRRFSKPTATISLKKPSGDVTERKEKSITIKVETQIKDISTEEENNVSEVSNKSVTEDEAFVESKEEEEEKLMDKDIKDTPESKKDESDGDGDAEESSLVIDEQQPEPGRRRRRRRKKKEIHFTPPPQKRRTTDEDDPRWDTDIPPGATPFKFEGPDGSARESIIIPDKKLPKGWAKHTMLRRNNTKWDVFLVNPEGRKFRSRNELRSYYSEINETYPEDHFDFVVGRKQQLIEDSKNRSRTEFAEEQKDKPRIRRRRKRKLKDIPYQDKMPESEAVHKDQVMESGTTKIKIKPLPPKPAATSTPVAPTEVKRIKTLLPKSKPVDNDDKKLGLPMNSEVSSPLPVPFEPLPVTPLLPSLSLSISSPGQEGFTCPIDGCGKNFRKENLLQMHIKHYHPEYSNLVGSTPNVADLAYARTTGEPLEDSRAEMALSGTSFIDRINRFEAERKARASDVGQSWNVSAAKKISLRESPILTTPKTPERDVPETMAAEPLSEDTRDADVSSSGFESPAVGSHVSPKSSPASLILPAAPQPDGNVLETVPGEEAPQQATEMSTTAKGVSNSEKEEKTSAIKTILPLRQPVHSSVDMMKLIMEEESDEEAGHYSTSPNNKSSQKILRSEDCPSLTPKKIKPEETIKLEKEEKNDKQALVLTSPSGGTSYRFARQRTPLVSLEKLHVTPDSNGRVVLSATDLDIRASVKENATDKTGVENHMESLIEPLRKDEIINCTCGYMEEDGLMIQCDLCLCWQHGLCNNISKESEVPEKYVCNICQHPSRQRKSFRFAHNQDWIREGKLPSLSFRTKNEPELGQREHMLKNSHELAASVLQLQSVIQSLRVKTHIAQKPDHPKLYLWAKSWSKEADVDLKKENTDETQNSPERKDIMGRIPEPEAAIDVEDCQLRLLEHIEDYQHQLEARLTSLQAQVAALESEDPDLASDEGPEFYPITKQTIQMILRDLNTVQKISAIN